MYVFLRMVYFHKETADHHMVEQLCHTVVVSLYLKLCIILFYAIAIQSLKNKDIKPF